MDESMKKKLQELKSKKSGGKKPAKPGLKDKLKESTSKNSVSKELTYYTSNIEKMKEDLAEMQVGGFFRPKENSKYTIRILPAWKEDGAFYREIRHHWVTMPDGSRAKIQCVEDKHGNRLLGFPCYLCEKAKKLSNSNNERSQKAGNRLRVQTRYTMNIIDFTNPESPKVGLIYEAPRSVVKALIDIYFDDNFSDFTDPQKGYNFTLKRDDSGSGPTKYTITPHQKSTRLRKEWVQKGLRDLDEYYKYPTNEELQAIADNIIIDDDEDDF